MQKLAHYQIEDLLGEGSFAWVYRAYDQKFDQYVALKILKPNWLGDPQAIARFKQEAKTARKLRHSHIVDVYDVGETGGQVYLAQLLIEGKTLADQLTPGSLKWDEVVRISRDIGSALDYAHSQGIIHRDVKPQNILLDKNNQAFLGDFGLVRAVEGSTHLSSTMSMVGTARYMAPEIWDGKKAIPASDVYALSCVVYEMLTGKVLFEGSSMAAVTKQHIIGPQFPEHWPENVPEGVTDVLRRGLAEDPAERVSSAGELATQLATLSAAPKPSPPSLVVPTDPAAPIPAAKSTAKSDSAYGPSESSVAPAKTPFPRSPESKPTPSASRGTPAPVAQRRSTNWLLIGVLAGGLLLVMAIFSALILLIPDTPAPPPAPLASGPLPSTITAADGSPMVLVPAGPFMMGSDDADDALAECQQFRSDCQRSWFEDAEPVHEVTLDAFYIDQYEVTNIRYAACEAAGECDPPAENSSNTRESYYGNPAYDDYPVINVNWEQARSYCEWRGDRLPTEAEWEKAARGTDGQQYPWGNDFDGNRLNYCDRNCGQDWADQDYDDGHSDTAPVGSYANGVSPYGAADMAGNVFEWVADWYDEDYYATAPSHNPQGPASGEDKVLRGGSWSDHVSPARSAHRAAVGPDNAGDLLGFRCVGAAPE